MLMNIRLNITSDQNGCVRSWHATCLGLVAMGENTPPQTHRHLRGVKGRTLDETRIASERKGRGRWSWGDPNPNWGARQRLTPHFSRWHPLIHPPMLKLNRRACNAFAFAFRIIQKNLKCECTEH